MQNVNRCGVFIQITIIIGLMTLVAFIYLLFFTPAHDFSIRIKEDKHITSQIGGDFTLTDQNGNVFSSDQLKGSICLVYFGCTRCPHHGSVAPEKLVEIKKRMNENHIPVRIVFITLDPEYDTPKILKNIYYNMTQRLLV